MIQLAPEPDDDHVVGGVWVATDDVWNSLIAGRASWPRPPEAEADSGAPAGKYPDYPQYLEYPENADYPANAEPAQYVDHAAYPDLPEPIPGHSALLEHDLQPEIYAMPEVPDYVPDDADYLLPARRNGWLQEGQAYLLPAPEQAHYGGQSVPRQNDVIAESTYLSPNSGDASRDEQRAWSEEHWTRATARETQAEGQWPQAEGQWPQAGGQQAQAGGQQSQAGAQWSQADGRAQWRVPLEVRKAQRVMIVVAALLVVLDFLASAAVAAGAPYQLTRFFDADSKVNFPTGFKTTMLLLVTLLLAAQWAVDSRTRAPFAPAWRLLTYVAAFAFVDETVYLHQSLAQILHEHLHTQGPLLYAWTIVYAPVAVAVLIIMLRYLRHLDRRLMRQLIVGGGAYVLGTLAFEPIKSEIAEVHGDGTMAFKLTAACSDSLEMIGLTVLAVILLAELARTTKGVTLNLNLGRPRTPVRSRDLGRQGAAEYRSY
jgi:hypothetical protein